MEIKLDNEITITLWKESNKKKDQDAAMIKVERIVLDSLDFQTLIAPQKVKRNKIGNFFERKIYDEIYGFFGDDIAPKLKETALAIYNNWDKIEVEEISEKDEEITFDAERPILYPAFGTVEHDNLFAIVESGYAMTNKDNLTFASLITKSDHSDQSEHIKNTIIIKYFSPPPDIQFKELYSLPSDQEEWLIKPKTMKKILDFDNNVDSRNLIKNTYNKLKKIVPKHIWLKETYHNIFVAEYPILTYLFHVFDNFPLLQLIGTENSGKTRLCQYFEATCYHANMRIDPSRSDLFRSKEEHQPTLILDENKEYDKLEANMLLDIINGSYSRGGSVPRREKMVIDGKEIYQQKLFKLYSPLIMSGIFPKLRIDTRTRVIQIPMYKHSSDIYSIAKRDNYKEIEDELFIIRMVTAYDIKRHYDSIKDDINIYPELTDRNREIWLPFFVLLDYIGEHEDLEQLRKYVIENNFHKAIQSSEQDIKFKLFQSFVRFLDILEGNENMVYNYWAHKPNNDEIHIPTNYIVDILGKEFEYATTPQSLGQQLWMIGAKEEGKRHPNKAIRLRSRIYRKSEVEKLLRESYQLSFEELRECS